MGLEEFISGLRPDLIVYDEERLTSGLPMREVVAVDERDGRTVTLQFPADWDLGEVLPPHHRVGLDAAA